jgi:hypothetical protein
VLILARGEHFNHKNKNHPGEFPKNTQTEKHAKQAIGDEEFLVTQEAFKNRLEEEEQRSDTGRWLPEQTE